MKYYVINSDGKEISFDITGNSRLENGIIAYNVSKEDTTKDYYFKKLAGKTYISNDGTNWKKSTPLSTLSHIVNGNDALKVYRGFKPSGLGSSDAGSLITDMPGKVVKVLTTEGAVVNQGDTLLILEAMKMENEIKAGMDGVVKAVHVGEGQALESGHLMIEIEE
ncbi:MAG: acetyl-CoA carboxylase biotin carboxyl carrier protein subunit [Bacteriovoracaceae bacterium]|jgi:biotin carboxyl carrier protein|nr:acetyl-CoA carboxylase biotin carboxyl carrier protein subunit [Bacteriovoracaceae bacterium]